MRDILFRGKTEGLSSWIYGVPISFADGTMWLMTATDYNGLGVGINHVEVKSGTVGQWTGLVDKNGVKVFEGDVVLTKYGRACIVEWFEPKLCFDLQPLDNPETLRNRAPDPWDIWYAENLEVIGNVYDGYKLPEVKE